MKGCIVVGAFVTKLEIGATPGVYSFLNDGTTTVVIQKVIKAPYPVCNGNFDQIDATMYLLSFSNA